MTLKQCGNQFNKDFKNDPHKKNLKKEELQLPALDPLVLKTKVNHKSMNVEIVLYFLQ